MFKKIILLLSGGCVQLEWVRVDAVEVLWWSRLLEVLLEEKVEVTGMVAVWQSWI